MTINCPDLKHMEAHLQQKETLITIKILIPQL